MFGIAPEWWILYGLLVVLAFVLGSFFIKGNERPNKTLQDLLHQIRNDLNSFKDVNRRLEAVLKYYFPYRGEDVKVGLDSLVEEIRETNAKLHKISHELYELKKGK